MRPILFLMPLTISSACSLYRYEVRAVAMHVPLKILDFYAPFVCTLKLNFIIRFVQHAFLMRHVLFLMPLLNSCANYIAMLCAQGRCALVMVP